ncbi:hypothetical protein RH858_00660 [Halalkaliarchaeum sp. AArc-GB]|nr:hypothetical protein [Halalkaliarchaeum sp. AArc-GB]MDR5671667.1 hypothetical protein [Halalkaliarchaeum sp. AArc-GB]
MSWNRTGTDTTRRTAELAARRAANHTRGAMARATHTHSRGR